MSAGPSWQEVLPGVHLFRDSCNVYAVEAPEGCLVVDAGTGLWLEHAAELPAAPVALACTHFFRDHSAGAVAAARSGIAVYVPEGELEPFVDPELHFLRRESYVVYDNYWDHFAPIEAVPVTGVLRDHEVLQLAGLELEVLPLPGATVTQVGLELLLPADGSRVVFCGETIHTPGRVARVAPLQYGYNDLPGAWNVVRATRELRRRQPDALLPSLGEPILMDTGGALAALEQSLRAHGRRRSEEWGFATLDRDPFLQVTESVWRTAATEAHGTFVIGPSGAVLAIDTGYGLDTGDLRPAPLHRRGEIETVRRFLEQTGARGVEVVLVSHYHDDHVVAIPLLQRVHGSTCWAPEWFADVLEHPDEFAFPCTWPVPVRVDRRLREGEPAVWEGIELHVAPMSGHTRFSAAIGFEADGVRYAHIGDQYGTIRYFLTNGAEHGDWENDEISANHVYRNGAFLRSFAESARWLRSWRPQVVLSGHQLPMWTDDAFFARVDEFTEAYEADHLGSMALGEDEAHFDVDSWGGWIRPYRTFSAEPRPLTLRVTVRNPFPREATVGVRLVGPTGWHGTSATLAAAPRQEVSCELSITPPGRCRRQPIAAELTADGRPFGQVAEALVTVGGERF
jgi:glyoxylase-like metal-dependent hydrolase (beta-lactamase superfamily II)